MKNTYYSLYKWGDLSVEADIDELLISILEEKLETTLSMDQLKTKQNLDNVSLGDEHLPKLSKHFVKEIISIVGEENVSKDDYHRALFAQGKSYRDALKLRSKIIQFPPDLIVAPKDENEVIQIVELCSNNSISIIPVGGRSSVTSGIEFSKGGIALDCTKHLNKIIEVNDINQTVKVQPGIYGPALEEHLNNYKSNNVDTNNNYGFTCGHFPQSFEFSTVGGWVAARGAGQESTGYGKIENIVLGLRIVTPKGLLIIEDYPARSTGPDLSQIFIGSEGYFGVITEITLKISTYRKESTSFFSLLFKDWHTGVQAMRGIMQGGYGK
ncbi:MAG: FAD-binding oxidoreductase, partial [Candidatus Heimdallarchaeota archaeon]